MELTKIKYFIPVIPSRNQNSSSNKILTGIDILIKNYVRETFPLV